MDSTEQPNCDFQRYLQSLRHANKYFEFLNSRVDKTYSSPDEYFKDLDVWLHQTFYFWNLTAKFPHYLAQQQVASRLNSQQSRQRSTSTADANETIRPNDTIFNGKSFIFVIIDYLFVTNKWNEIISNDLLSINKTQRG